jgi:N-acetylmuramoyl-L-alanine amidase
MIWKYLVFHCTAGEWGSPRTLWRQHVEINKWRDWGYNKFILNGFITYEDYSLNRRWDIFDGSIVPGRSVDLDSAAEWPEIGAHVRGWNSKALGVAVVGNERFTLRQILSMKCVYEEIRDKINPDIEILGHYELDPNKTCPNMNMNVVRKWLLDEGGKGAEAYTEIVANYVFPSKKPTET